MPAQRPKSDLDFKGSTVSNELDSPHDSRPAQALTELRQIDACSIGSVERPQQIALLDSDVLGGGA